MRLEGTERLRRKLKQLPKATRKHVTRAVERNTKEGVRVAKVLAPELSGETKARITARFEEEGMVGIVEAIDPQAPRDEKDRQYSIEHGRDKGERGTTQGARYMAQTRSYMAKKAKASIKRAINKAAKEVAGNGG